MTRPQFEPVLSTADSKVLHAVFDPESAPEAPKVTVNPSLPSDANIHDTELLSSLRSREVAAVKVIEACSSSDETAKDQAYSDALARLNAIIEEEPSYASAWNNRAQLRRWRYGDRGVLTTQYSASLTSQMRQARRTIISAIRDLDQAIFLASPPSSSLDKAVSPTQGKLLAQAWTQRAAIFWGVAKDLSSPDVSLILAEEDDESVPAWNTWDKTRSEEEGSRCFFMAGLYGSEVGRAMAVLSNPTAKLCGNIVKEALERERGDS